MISNRNMSISTEIEDFKEMGSHISMVDHLKRSLYLSPADDPILALQSRSLPLIEASVNQFCSAIHSIYQPKSVVNVRFVARLTRSNCVSPYSFLLALIYIERLKRKNPIFIRNVPPKELFLVALLVASKYLYDDGEEEEVFNSHFAKCSNLPLISVNQAEKRFLSAIEWEIFVDPPQFFKQLVHLEKLMMQSECKKRSFSSLTYSELRRFLNDHDLKTMSSQIVQRLLHSMFLFLLGYSVLVLSVTLSTVCLLQIEQFANHIKVIQTASSQMSNHHWTSNSAGLSNSIEPPLYSQIELHQTMSNNHIKLHSDRSRPATFHSVFIHSNDINHILAQNWTRHASLRLSKPIGLTYNYDLVNPFSWFMIRL